MKKNNSKILIVLAAIVVVLIIVLMRCSMSVSEFDVAADSVLASNDNGVFYNNIDNNIMRRNLGSDETVVFAEDLTLLSVSDREVLATDGNNFIIMDNSGEVVDRVEGIVVLAAQITDDYIYYKHIDSRYVVQLDRTTGDVKDILPIAVDKFEVHGKQVVFTVDDKKMVYFYDTETGLPMGYFGDKLIADFTVEDNFLIYSDLNAGGKVTKMNLSGGSEEELKGIKTGKFVYKYGKVYYVKNVGKNKKAYELMEYKGN